MNIPWREARRLIPNLDELLRREGNGPSKPPTETAVAVPICTRLEVSPGRWQVTIANYCPTSDNVRAKGVKAWNRAKKADREVIRDWLADFARVPRASCRRRLSMWVTKKGPQVDGANLNKSFRDGLVNCGLLVDDSAEWLEGSDPIVTPSKVTSTTILIEDIS